MSSVVHSMSSSRGRRLRLNLLHGAMYPLFLAAGALQRVATRVDAEGASRTAARRSLFVEATASTSIAISYILMARTTLQLFARRNRTERLS